MKSAVIVIMDGAIVVYQSEDTEALEKEVVRAKEKGYPYAILVQRDEVTTF